MATDFFFRDTDWISLGQSYAVDFFLAYVFFFAISFAVLGKRLEHRRSAAAASAALGAALAIGLVAWQVRSGWRIADLGPIAAGFALIVLAVVIHQAVRRLGGDWAGGAVALGAALLIGTVLRLPWPVSQQTVGTLAALTLVMGAGFWFLHHTKSTSATPPAIRSASRASRDPEDAREAVTAARQAEQQVQAIDDVRRVEKQIERSFDGLERSTRKPISSERPAAKKQIADIRQELARLIPAEGSVTRRLADLRARSVMTRNGHLARLRRLSAEIPRLPPLEARQAAKQLRAAYRAANFDRRIERLDAAAAEVEKRIQRLTAQAEVLARAGQTDHLRRLITDARSLQHHATKLVGMIERDERKLLGLALQEVRQMTSAAA